MPAARFQPAIRVLPHISRALESGEPVVALESSVFAQGLPRPTNADAARRMIAAVEDAGAIAAITAVVCGTPCVGIEEMELQQLLGRDGIRKVSARDLAVAVALRQDGATTVAASIVLARRAGIRVFATGGIGGVHRKLHVQDSRSNALDESADLEELARTPMVAVCAGAKSILDLPATFERLETLGIPVIGFGTSQFPGFFAAETGIPLEVSVSSATEIAEIATAHFALGRSQSVLVVQQPPARLALESETIERAVTTAIAAATRDGVRGPELTPFLLEAVARETGGRTLDANVAILESNAALAGRIAAAM